MKPRKFISMTILTAFIMLLLTACGTTDVDVSQYIKLTFEGMNGQGVAVLNCSGLEEAVPEYDILNDIDFELDKDSNLSNGDIVTLEINADNKSAKKNGVNIIGTDTMTFTVSNLKEIKEIDPFDPQYFNITHGEGVYIDFTGISPNASVEITNNLPISNPLWEVEYSLAENIDGEIHKGQQIKIHAAAPYQWEDEGYALKSTDTTVTCENVDEYVKSIDDIDDEAMNTILEQCEDMKKSHFNTGYYTDFPQYIAKDGEYISPSRVTSFDNYKYLKKYFFVLKDGAEPKKEFEDRELSDTIENGMFVSFSVDLTKIRYYNKDGSYDEKNAVGYYYIYNLVKNKDGEIEFKSGYAIIGDFLYVNESEMEKNITEPNSESYTFTEKAFDEK